MPTDQHARRLTPLVPVSLQISGFMESYRSFLLLLPPRPCFFFALAPIGARSKFETQRMHLSTRNACFAGYVQTERASDLNFRWFVHRPFALHVSRWQRVNWMFLFFQEAVVTGLWAWRLGRYLTGASQLHQKRTTLQPRMAGWITLQGNLGVQGHRTITHSYRSIWARTLSSVLWPHRGILKLRSGWRRTSYRLPPTMGWIGKITRRREKSGYVTTSSVAPCICIRVYSVSHPRHMGSTDPLGSAHARYYSTLVSCIRKGITPGEAQAT